MAFREDHSQFHVGNRVVQHNEIFPLDGKSLGFWQIARLAVGLRSPLIAEDHLQQMREDQILREVRITHLVTLLGVLAAAMLIISGPGGFSHRYATSWFILHCLWVTWICLARQRFARQLESRVNIIYKHFLLLYAVPLFGIATSWSFLSWIYPLSEGDHYYLAIITLASCAALGTLWTQANPLLSAVFSSGALIPLAVKLIQTQPPSWETLLSLALLYWLILLVIVFSNYMTLIESQYRRFQQQEQRRKFESLLREFEENSSDWLWRTSPSGALLAMSSVNQARAAGGNSVSKMFSDSFGQDSAEVRELMAIMQKRVSFARVDVPSVVTGDSRWWRLSGRPQFSTSGQFEGYLGVGSDVTADRSARELAERNRRSEAISEMSGVVAHDFNNVLAVVAGNLELILLTSEPDSATSTRASQAIASCHRGAKIASQLLSFSKREVLVAESVELSSLISVIVDEAQLIWPQVCFTQEGDQDVAVMADPTQLYRALSNIVVNACQAVGDDGSVEVCWDRWGAGSCSDEVVSALVASSSLAATDDFISIRFRDNGGGFNDDIVDRVFEPFVSSKGLRGGAGLGLSMVQGFAEQSRGAAAVKNWEHGAQVDLILPKAEVMPSKALLTPADLSVLAGVRILVIEDELDLQMLLVRRLELAGCVVHVGSSLTEGRAMIEAHNFDVLLSDIVLPDGSGVELGADVTSRGLGIKVIYMTAFADAAVIDNVPVLRKPFTSDDILSLVALAVT